MVRRPLKDLPLDQGGHTWPGGRSYLPRIVGKTSRDVDASRMIRDFFARHSLR